MSTRAAMKALWVTTLAAAPLVGCSGDETEPVEFTATAVCPAIEQDASGKDIQGCEVTESSDGRIAGATSATFVDLQVETWDGIATITNDAGSWSGTFEGSRDGQAAVSEFQMTGAAEYEGLVATYTATNPAVEHDGSGVLELAGVIAPSP